jgi:hypothetical protein
VNYTQAYSMTDPFWGTPMPVQQRPRSPASLYQETLDAPGGANYMWKQAMMGSLPGVMEDMDMNRTLTDWWPGAGPTFTRSPR